MNTALSWIKEYVPDLDIDVRKQEDVDRFADAMTLSGTKVEGYVRLDKNLDKIVVGKILDIKNHPDANKLVVCQVDVGDKNLQIVTGASNIKVGDKVPIVLDGGRVSSLHAKNIDSDEGFAIKKGELRGVLSEGMMCSIEELGCEKSLYSDECTKGIYILDPASEVGSDAVELIGLRDVVYEYEITSNRVDCYSVVGIAREVGATFNKAFKFPCTKVDCKGDEINNYLSVDVQNTNLCSRYIARVVKNIKLAPSPKWMQDRLRSCGIRPINNIVDITNYIMEEMGQPMHAYDYDMIKGHKIVVKNARDGEEFVTLDGTSRKLTSNTLMICDGEKAVGIAGIMGGENSMITDDVSTMVFESATFDGTNIRICAKALGLRTDASGKFEKGLDPNNAKTAMDRAIYLIQELGAGEVVEGIIDIYPNKVGEKRIKFDYNKINKILGSNISEEEMLEYFNRIEFEYDESNKELIIPTFRQDIEMCADLAEEVARFYGYDKIADTLPSGESTIGGISKKNTVEKYAREVAMSNGYSESMTYSFESPKVYDKLLIDKDSRLRKCIEISNPLGEDFSIMRTLPINGILNSLATNYNRRNKDVKLFELANTYLPETLPLKTLPDERVQFVLGAYGNIDFFELKGVVEEVFERMGVNRKMEYKAECEYAFLHPTRKAEIICKDDIIGYIGEVHPDVCLNYKIGTKVYLAVIDIPKLVDLSNFDKIYKGIAKYPGITRDISLVVPKNINAGTIDNVIEDACKSLLEDYSLFDVYEGDQLEQGFKSLAYKINFRHNDRTLEDKEVNVIMNDLFDKLSSMGINLRA